METLITILIICCIASAVIIAGNSNRDKELYYLKNLKFLEENPDSIINNQDNFGDYYVSYLNNGKKHYHFFSSRKKRNLQCPKIAEKFNCAGSIEIGKRLSYLPENNQW